MVRVFYTDIAVTWSDEDKDEKVLFEQITNDVPQIGTKVVFAGMRFEVTDVERYFAHLEGKSVRAVSIEVHVKKV